MVCMIDWISAEVACKYTGVITGGEVLTIDADGTIEWSKERGLSVDGSHSSKMVVRAPDSSVNAGCVFSISGNPVKFLQGHNLFGSDDMRVLVARTMEVIADRLGLVPSENNRASWWNGFFMLSRVDVTRSYDLGSPDRVRDWLASAAQVAHSRYQPAGNKYAGTLYVGQNSRRVSLKIYDKLAEIQKAGHRLPDTLPKEWYHLLTEWASGKLRCEATFRAMWLKDNNRAVGAAWSPGIAERLLDERLGGLEMSDTMKLTDEYTGELPGKLALVYEAWRNGRDLKSMYSERHFYRLRSQLLPFGIDIAHVRPREVVTENQYIMGAPLKSFLQPGGGAPVPGWALDTPMYISA